MEYLTPKQRKRTKKINKIRSFLAGSILTTLGLTAFSNNLESKVNINPNNFITTTSNGFTTIGFEDYQEIPKLKAKNSYNVPLNWLSECSKYRNIIENAANQHKEISNSLLTALCTYEGMGNHRAKSPTGPIGITQLGRDAATDLNITVNYFIDERYNPEIAIPAGAQYLASQINRFNGNIREALIHGYHTLHGLTTEEEIKKVENYADNILRTANLLERNELEYKQLLLYTEEIKNTYSIKVKKGETLTSISDREGVSVTDIIEVNPLRSKNRLEPGSEIKIPIKSISSQI